MCRVVLVDVSRVKTWPLLLVSVALVAASCGASSTGQVDAGASAENVVVERADTGQEIDSAPELDAGGLTESGVNPDCVPSADVPASGLPSSQDDRRFEDIEELVTGHRSTAEEEGEEPPVAPDFGGIWGDLTGGIVVAVLDCSTVDADELARIAGGPDYLHLIEVPYSFDQVNDFRDQLYNELSAANIEASVLIDSTLTGRMISVHVPDLQALPADFGASVPAESFNVVGPPPPSGPLSIPLPGDNPLVHCGFPVQYALLETRTEADSDDPAFAAVVAMIARSSAEFGDLPTGGWDVLHQADDRAVFGMINRDAQGALSVTAMQAENSEGRWHWSGSSAGECNLRVVLPHDVSRVDWQIPSERQPLAADTTLNVIASEWECDFENLAGRIRTPLVTETDDAVLIGLAADRLADPGMNCPIDESQAVELEIQLTSHLGDRVIRDGFQMPDPQR